MERPAWVKDKNVADDFEVIKVREIDHIKDERMDVGCYTLIKVYFDSLEIGVAVCNHQHVILKEFRGRTARDIYHAIFEHEEKNNFKWFTNKNHIAYIGKELKKAELALTLGFEYQQE